MLTAFELTCIGWAHRAWEASLGDLRPAGMRPGQRGGEGDAGAGDLCAGRVRMS